MIVLTLTDCPSALRGDLTKWLQEINTGVYVGQVSARVRDEIWERVCENAKSGRATMVFSTNNEQHMDFRVHHSSWEPIDFDGLKLMLRPSPARIKKLSERRLGYSKAAKMRKARQMSKAKSKSRSAPDTYVVMDIETTGLSFMENEIIEIGAIIVKEREIVNEFHAMINPKVKVPASITALTGITDQEIENDGRTLKEVLQEFLEFVGDFPVIAHNADFEYGFLRSACEKCKFPLFSNQWIDTLQIARRLVYDVNNYKLETLLEYFGLQMNGLHRSMQDCLSTKQVYEKLIDLEQKDK